MKISLSLLICILLVLNLSESLSIHEKPRCQKSEYSGALLALSWIGQFCSEKTCSPQWHDNWDGKSFTIHGYWPQSDDKSALACLNKDGYDKYCFQNYTFQEDPLSDMSDELNLRWPQVGPKKDFWKYEWDKHGTCYLKLTLDSYNSDGLSEDDIFHKFFRQTLDKYNALNVSNLSKFEFASKAELASEIGVEPDQFFAICGKDNQLDEIRVCYNLDVPGAQKVVSCGNPPKECSGSIVLKQK